ncbi:MAG: acyl-CoA dehydrogenase domain protein [Actinomycetia bacterium]|jgi:alkylation response protein AidB-like acyl-CoA dehydrogenase|nr:acyl-CoA dehydrogenase domain protein [Actinomycetes bacterium]
MDFTLTPQTTELRDLAGAILRECSTPGRLDSLDASGEWLDRRTYRALADAGVLGAVLPEDAGGAGLGLTELHYLLQQAGMAAAQVPLLETVALGAVTIARLGTAAQRDRWLPGVVAGTTLLTAALAEPAAAGRGQPAARARKSGAGWSLSGASTQVPLAGLADAVLVPATMPDGTRAIFLIDPRADGVTLRRQHTLAPRPAWAMHLESAQAGPDNRIGPGGPGGLGDCGGPMEAAVDDLLLRAGSALASVQSGVCAAALRLTADHVRTREQFGRPIGTFQAVRQRLADAWIDTEAAQLTSLQAAWRLSAGLDAADAVAIARWWAAEAGHRVLHTAHHLHGGTGIDLSYPLHRYFRLAKQIEFSLGGANRELSGLGRALAARPGGPPTTGDGPCRTRR